MSRVVRLRGERTRFTLSTEVAALAAKFRSASLDVVTYGELQRLVGNSDPKRAIPSARRVLLRENIIIATVRGVGVRRLTEEEAALSFAASAPEKIRRASRRELRNLRAAMHDPTKVSAGTMARAEAARTLMQFVKYGADNQRQLNRAAPGASPHSVALLAKLFGP